MVSIHRLVHRAELSVHQANDPRLSGRSPNRWPARRCRRDRTCPEPFVRAQEGCL